MSIVGTCQSMCPITEVKRREKQKLLHKFELTDNSERQKPKADLNRIVKEFSRPSAGQALEKADSLRPANVLLETMDYLINNIICKDEPWTLIYDFVTDRFRAICQDMTIQQLSSPGCVTILECCVRFYLLSAYKLCNEKTVLHYDPHINETLLMDCLKRLLVMYGRTPSLEDHINLPEMVSIYLLFNLGSADAIRYSMQLPKCIRLKQPLKYSIEMSLFYWQGNLFKLLRVWRSLSPLLSCCLHRHIQIIRRKLLQILSVAYSSKNCQFPITTLSDWLSFNDANETLEFCLYYGIQKGKDTSTVVLLKSSFNEHTPILPPNHDRQLDEKFYLLELSNLVGII